MSTIESEVQELRDRLAAVERLLGLEGGGESVTRYACPRCKAGPGEFCRTPGGSRVDWHKARRKLVPSLAVDEGREMGRTTGMLLEAIEAARRGQPVLVVMASREAAAKALEMAASRLSEFKLDRSQSRINTHSGYLKVLSERAPGLGVGSRERVFVDHAARLALGLG